MPVNGHDQRIFGDLRALNVLGTGLLGREVSPAILVHVLWRPLCGPMMVWPHWTPNGCKSCGGFSHVAAELGQERCCNAHQVFYGLAIMIKGSLEI